MKNRHPGNSVLVEGPIKIAPCVECGHIRQVSVRPENADEADITRYGLCGRGSCIKKREKKDD